MSIQNAYNQWAKQYDTNKNKTRDLDRIVTKETLGKYAFKTVLELGCGTGKNTAWLLTKAEHITGLDFSEEMLTKAKEKINSPYVVFQQADLKNSWNIKAQSFDLITSSLTLEHLENLNHIFLQANKALIDGGIFFISELHPFKQYMGSKARYETENGVEELEVYIHHLSDYITNATHNQFEMLEVNEWFDKPSTSNIPRLISFVFRKISRVE